MAKIITLPKSVTKEDQEKYLNKKSIVKVIGPFRCSFADQIRKPKENQGGKLQYSVLLMLDKDDKAQVADIKNSIIAACKIGLVNGVFTPADVARLHQPLKDGDEAVADALPGFTSDFKNHLYFSTNSYNKPGVVDAAGNPDMEESVNIYSGCWIRCHVGFYPFHVRNQKTGQSIKKGLSIGLNHVMFVKDDDRLDGRVPAIDAFAEFKSDDGVEAEDGNLL